MKIHTLSVYAYYFPKCSMNLMLFFILILIFVIFLCANVYQYFIVHIYLSFISFLPFIILYIQKQYKQNNGAIIYIIKMKCKIDINCKHWVLLISSCLLSFLLLPFILFYFVAFEALDGVAHVLILALLLGIIPSRTWGNNVCSAKITCCNL